jgi:hypothetical protein
MSDKLLENEEIENEENFITEDEQTKDLFHKLYQFYEFCKAGGFEIRGIKKGILSDQFVRFKAGD